MQAMLAKRIMIQRAPNLPCPTVIPAVTADFCLARDESITDMAESDRFIRAMRAFVRQVDAT